MRQICVIFDLDGTLVDSEELCNQAFLDLLPNLTDSVQVLTERYRGMKLELIINDLISRLDHRLPKDFESTYRTRVSELFKKFLRPVSGVPQMLASINYPKCVASSGPLAKIRESLALCNLAEAFGENIFSSYVVKSWKPAPGLFLHAAKVMGYKPQDCVVVEDSHAGIDAAVAAGMMAIHFVPRLSSETRNRAIEMTLMSQLPALLENHVH